MPCILCRECRGNATTSLAAAGNCVAATHLLHSLQVLEVFKDLGIKTVPVTLKGSALAKAAISIILGEPMLRLAMWHAASQEVLHAPVPLAQHSKAALCRAVQAAQAGLRAASERAR